MKFKLRAMEAVHENRKFEDEEDVFVKVEIESDCEETGDNEMDIETAENDRVEQRIPQVEPVQNGPFTNFSIEEILKPSFGQRRCNVHSGRSSNNNRQFNHNNVNIQNSPQSRGSLKPSPLLKTSPGFARRQSSPKFKDENTSPGLYSPGSNSSSSSSPGTSPGSDARGLALPLPAWVYCTRYSDRPSSGPRTRKIKKKGEKMSPDDKRPRTAFSNDQLQRLKHEFDSCQYLTEQRRRDLARELQLSEGQIKIWFQNKRAKVKKSAGSKNMLALHLMAQGLYNHSTMQLDGETCN